MQTTHRTFVTRGMGGAPDDELLVAAAAAGGTYLIEVEFTQWRSLVGVSRSPTNTCPRWPSQAAHRISTRTEANASDASSFVYLNGGWWWRRRMWR